MSVYDWIEKTMKPKYLTIRHIVKMKRGKTTLSWGLVEVQRQGNPEIVGSEKRT